MIYLIMALSYIIGSIPFGFLVVKTFSGQDVRQVGSGRTGGTNAMRAAGLSAGILTALLDTVKGAACVWLARLILPADTQVIGMVLAGLFAIVGHNYSVFLGFKGGAGGAPTVGGAFAIWPWSFVIAVPLCMGVLFGIGYASLATIAAGVIITALFAYLAYAQPASFPAAFILYGVGACILLVWALRPNIRRLLQGQERMIGWRAKRMKQNAGAEPPAKGR